MIQFKNVQHTQFGESKRSILCPIFSANSYVIEVGELVAVPNCFHPTIGQSS